MVALFCGVTNCPITAMLISFELFGFSGAAYYLIAISISYAVSGYYSLYKDQTIVYSKYKARYINRKTRQQNIVSERYGQDDKSNQLVCEKERRFVQPLLFRCALRRIIYLLSGTSTTSSVATSSAAGSISITCSCSGCSTRVSAGSGFGCCSTRGRIW